MTTKAPSSASRASRALPAAGPRLRADAVRNRQRILEAAEEVFSGEGLAVPIDAVAERAGLGIGTLYRHFPTKEALFCALVIGRFERLAGELEAVTATADPASALLLFLDRLAALFTNKKHLMDALGAENVTYDERMVGAKIELHRVLDRILERGRDHGSIRGDVTAEDVFRLVHGVYNAAGGDGEARTRLLSVVCAGLRVPAPAGKKTKREGVSSSSRGSSPRRKGPRRGSAP